MTARQERHMKILIVEGESIDRGIIEKALSSMAGMCFNLTFTMRLREAINVLKKEAFDIIFLSLDLPDSKGLDTLNVIKLSHSEAAIIVFINKCDEEIGVKTIKNGAQDYLCKDCCNEWLLRKSIYSATERKKIETAVKDAGNRCLKMNKELEHVTFIDPHTDLFNYRYFQAYHIPT